MYRHKWRNLQLGGRCSYHPIQRDCRGHYSLQLRTGSSDDHRGRSGQSNAVCEPVMQLAINRLNPTRVSSRLSQLVSVGSRLMPRNFSNFGLSENGSS
jgi:hypothetical protein